MKLIQSEFSKPRVNKYETAVPTPQEVRSLAAKKKKAFKLIEANLNNLKIAEEMHISYEQAVMYRIAYEKAHFSGN